MYERVYVEMDWNDGPVEGVANYRGNPHYFVRKLDEEREAYEGDFELRPIDAETLTIAMASWKIFVAWNESYESGFAKTDTHPALPGVNPDFEMLEKKFRTRLDASKGPVVRAKAVLRSLEKRPRYIDSGPDYEIEWTTSDSE